MFEPRLIFELPIDAVHILKIRPQKSELLFFESRDLALIFILCTPTD